MAMFNLNDYILKLTADKLLTEVFDTNENAVGLLTHELKLAATQSIKMEKSNPAGDIKPYHHAEIWIVPDLTALQDAVKEMIHKTYREGLERGLSGD